jgi:nucleotide-binding universal stress UspA family protein
MAHNKRILVAVDKSEASGRAVAYVADLLAGQPGFHVGLFHLEAPPRMLEWGGSEDPEVEDRVEAQRSRAYQEMEEALREKGESLLRRSQALLSDRGVETTVLPVQWDEPLDRKNLAEDILQAAREGDSGTVVVGRHSYSGLKRLFHHHVGEELVRKGDGVTVWVVE